MDEGLIEAILTNTASIAVVGISEHPDRPSFQVAKYLERHFIVIPVNPMLETWEGIRCFPSVQAIPKDIRIDLVDVFRRSDQVEAVASDVLARGGIPYFWTQIGVSNDTARKLCEEAGMKVVQNRCTAVEHARLVRSGQGAHR